MKQKVKIHAVDTALSDHYFLKLLIIYFILHDVPYSDKAKIYINKVSRIQLCNLTLPDSVFYDKCIDPD